ncbi:MAG: cysteine--tRNA ligase [Candidatus Taylorbacteria bacterium RIFCSPHIGHO2_01_FULL_46_22b]|uniref:Cysteine--tRNA ligase n=1 Tax=Candidatus Taylorbacteria bacterium RIFCSPHIGHO2_01_FULL_46_22b TaxID=1802301 RepID=A0A1G2M1W3_9BACT|nr:MAG: cysteine--tRNA ligase [Candidatus Taylorbacteria bacterium RIFCSPHIGHO2_01_FULL_46_22b]
MFKFFLKEPPAPEVHVLFYNTLGRAKEHFVPLKAGRVSMYHCGPTVYGYTHIGHARAYVFADLIKRLFLYQGLTVNQIINITDVGHLTDDEDQGQDKIEEGARRENKTAKEIVELYTNDFMENLSKLNVDTDGTIFPKASEHILEQIAFIKTLEEKGYTYPTSDGIYFDTSRFPDYGKLGNIDLKGLEEGKRVAINAEKKHPTDFALWKFSKPEEKRQQEWESPWGKGFPGWHIECSAMSTKYLGHRFDIHTGGVDHIPVHHNNEIAQSNCALGVKSVNYWMHSEHLRIDGKKISKSLGNVILLKHVEERNISPLAYRYWLLTSHYRTPINFTWEALEAAHRGFYRLQKAFVEDLGVKKGSINATYRKTFSDALADDIDTPKAIATLWNLLKDTGVSKPDKKATLLDFDKVLGLGLSTAQEFLEGNKKEIANSDIPPEVENLLTERERARLAKDFKKADELRDKIKAAGFEISDTPDGAKLQKV